MNPFLYHLPHGLALVEVRFLFEKTMYGPESGGLSIKFLIDAGHDA